MTTKCVFRFDKARARFTLASLHPGVSASEVRRLTGFEYDAPAEVPTTHTPDADTLRLLRTDIARTIAGTYPVFAAKAWGIGG